MGYSLKPRGIEPLGERRDGRSLARRVPAFKDDDGGDAVVPAGLLEVVQTSLQPRHDALVFLARELLLQVDVFQHDGNKILYGRSPIRALLMGEDRPAKIGPGKSAASPSKFR